MKGVKGIGSHDWAFAHYWTWQLIESQSVKMTSLWVKLVMKKIWICFSLLFWHVLLLVLLLAIISHVSTKLGPITQSLKWERVIFASLPWGHVNTELIWRFPKIQTWNRPILSEVTSSVAAQIVYQKHWFNIHVNYILFKED